MAVSVRAPKQWCLTKIESINSFENWKQNLVHTREIASHAKLRGHQSSWLPCEIEALAIATALKHFGPYLVQSTNKACVLTDSKPCVQAYQKLCRGEFSTSPWVYTFLSTVSRYRVEIHHVAGASILPYDFASRNTPDCEDMACQVCNFIKTKETSAIYRTSVSDVLAGEVHHPFTSRTAWLSIQAECSDLRRTHAHLRQGTRPSRKITKIKDVKRYLRIRKYHYWMSSLRVVTQTSTYST